MDFVGSSIKMFEYYFLLGLNYNRILPQLFNSDQRDTYIPSSGQNFRYKSTETFGSKKDRTCRVRTLCNYSYRSHAETSALKFWKCISCFPYIIGTEL